LIENDNGSFPVSLDISFLPIDLFPGIQQVDFTDASIYHILRDAYRTTPKFSVVSMSARSIDQETRTVLGEPMGTRCLLHITGSTYDHNGACIEDSEVTYSTRVQTTMTIDHVKGHAEPVTLKEESTAPLSD
jgi:transcriptional regulator, GntR family